MQILVIFSEKYALSLYRWNNVRILNGHVATMTSVRVCEVSVCVVVSLNGLNGFRNDF